MNPPGAKPCAVILAAGRGNRLAPLTRDVPKCLLRVGERTILEHQIEALRAAGVTEIEIVTGHGAEHVREICGASAAYAHNAAHESTNSLDSLGCATLEVGGAGMLILNSDVLFHPVLLDRLLADERENVLLADFQSDLGEEEMKINVDGAGRLRRISKDIDPRAAHAENVGVLRLGDEAAGRLLALARSPSRSRTLCWVPDGIQHLAGEIEFHALAVEGLPWIEIDYLHDLERARDEIYPLVRAARAERTA